MVDDVTRVHHIQVHQALHGYAEGHRLLACSATLSTRDEKSMLVMSDASGPGARIDSNGYLTGYPLSESGLFALAWTWPAPEMPRPGCVWTHTLLIRFENLSAIQGPHCLLSAFVRPTATFPSDSYSGTRTLPVTGQWTPTGRAEAVYRRLALALYGHPNDRVIATRPDDVDVEGLVIRLWTQQWPRLQRTFRFCTMSFADRSTEGAKFDLQLLPSKDRPLRSRFSKALDADQLPLELDPWIDHAADDFSRPWQSELQQFLLVTGADVAGGRELFAPLCRLHQLLSEFERRPSSVGEAIALLRSDLGRSQARKARSMVINAAVLHPESLDGDMLDYLLENIEFLDQTDIGRLDALAAATWYRDPGLFMRFVERDDQSRQAGGRVLAKLPVTSLIKGVEYGPAITSYLVRNRPDIIRSAEFWSAVTNPREAIAIAQTKADGLAALKGMIESGNLALPDIAVRAFGSAAVLEAIATGAQNESASSEKSLRLWVISSTKEPGIVAQVLASQIIRSPYILSLVARVTSPDFVPNEYGADPWLHAVNAALTEWNSVTDDFLFSYLFARALGYRSRSQAELIQFSFDKVYAATVENHLTDEAWRIVDAKLPSAPYGNEQDRPLRLRIAVCNTFVYRHLSQEIFSKVTKDDQLFGELAALVARTSAGRWYLRGVTKALEESGAPNAMSRAEAVETYRNQEYSDFY